MTNIRSAIKIYVTPDEKHRIAGAARDCRLSLSAYVRMTALGTPTVSGTILDDIDDIMRVHADLGRLGGLLKMTLTNDERLEDIGREMAVTTIDNTLVDIRVTQAKLLELVDGATRAALTNI